MTLAAGELYCLSAGEELLRMFVRVLKSSHFAVSNHISATEQDEVNGYASEA